jgi:NitT/TauT family transport system substrate-binding protein
MMFLLNLLILVLLVTACNPQSIPTTTPIPVNTKIQLSWVHEYSSAPFHVAVQQGYFTAQGINAVLVEGGFNEQGYIDPIAQVVNGTVDFGMASASSILEARAQGQPVVAVANLLQRSPLGLISLDNITVQAPVDLQGKRVMVADGGARMLLDILLRQQDLDPTTLTIQSRTEFGIDPLTSGTTDVLVGWVINEGVALEEAALTPSYLLFSDYGLDLYEFVLFTTETILTEQPTTVQKVVDALRQGMQFTIENPAAAIEVTLSFAPTLDKQAQLDRLEATIPLMNVPGVGLGSMSPEVWQFTNEMLQGENLVPAGFDITTSYDLRFTGGAE